MLPRIHLITLPPHLDEVAHGFENAADETRSDAIQVVRPGVRGVAVMAAVRQAALDPPRAVKETVGLVHSA